MGCRLLFFSKPQKGVRERAGGLWLPPPHSFPYDGLRYQNNALTHGYFFVIKLKELQYLMFHSKWSFCASQLFQNVPMVTSFLKMLNLMGVLNLQDPSPSTVIYLPDLCSWLYSSASKNWYISYHASLAFHGCHFKLIANGTKHTCEQKFDNFDRFCLFHELNTNRKPWSDHGL